MTMPALLIPIVTACEAVLDFDRTPLQPIYEASVPAEGAAPEAGKTSSSSSSSGSGTSSSSSSSSSSTSSTGGPVDAGPDADSGSGS